MSATFIETVILEKCTCICCGIIFAIPETLKDSLRKNSGYYHCPNGHSQGYGESDADRFKKQLEQTQNELRASKCQTMHEQHKRIAAEAEATESAKKLKRVKNGVCPQCNRSFTNLRQHMATKHSCK